MDCNATFQTKAAAGKTLTPEQQKRLAEIQAEIAALQGADLLAAVMLGLAFQYRERILTAKEVLRVAEPAFKGMEI